ncbi:MAG: carbohydrate ABC transporter permease [Chloroflexi bacterium CFX4]|nr:carbohydrate ABC transporter permease [Chloroflexi bacterium CFX4]MDL1923315.1 carbohydrate ABC transporter permease [Chloroflexi bacterium CFX3]
MADMALSAGSRRAKRQINWFRLFVYVALSFAAIVYILPFAFMVGKSLQTSFEANNTTNILPTLGIQMQNYTDVLFGSQRLGVSRQFIVFLRNTIIIEIFSVVGQTVICVLAAYAFARMRFPGRNLIFGMLLMTLFVPSIIILVPNLIIVTQVDRFFRSIHPSLTWMNNWPALVIPFLSNTFSIFLLRQFFMQIPNELWEAARVDGAGHLRFLRSVVVPISWAPIMTTVLFCFVAVWSALEWPLLVTSDESWRPIAVALQQFRQDGGTQLHLLMAAAVVALLPVMILYFFTQRLFTQGISTSGLKG